MAEITTTSSTTNTNPTTTTTSLTTTIPTKTQPPSTATTTAMNKEIVPGTPNKNTATTTTATPTPSTPSATKLDTPGRASKPVYNSSIDETFAEKYECALLFHKNVANKGELSYDAKVDLVALVKQVTKGPCDEEKEPAIGYFDWLGADRREAWLSLDSMPQKEAMEQFCKKLNEFVPAFEPWYAARMEEKARKAQAERQRLEAERLERERVERERQEKRRQQELQREKLEQQRQQLAQQQQQQQQQLQAQQRLRHQLQQSKIAQTPQPKQSQQLAMNPPTSTSAPPTAIKRKTVLFDVNEFRESLRGQQKHEMVISPGEIVRMQARNATPGKTVLTWKFCTEENDLGFGLEYDLASNPQAAIETETETLCILPTTRIQAGQCVTVGQHSEIKPGSWSMLFDNSYSYFRSKTVFFVVTSA